MKYFRVFVSYTEFIPITELELEKALFGFITGSGVVFENGATSRIDRIVPDFHAASGWNPMHKISADDMTEMKKDGTIELYAGYLGEVKKKVEFLMNSGRIELIGKNVEVPELRAARNKLTGALAEAKKM